MTINMGENKLERSMYDILVEVVHVIPRIQWLRILGKISKKYNDLFMRFELEGVQYEIKGLKSIRSQHINSHRMEKIL